jgi:hypothetical protein
MPAHAARRPSLAQAHRALRRLSSHPSANALAGLAPWIWVSRPRAHEILGGHWGGDGLSSFTNVVAVVHHHADCAGQPCPLHAPSAHPLAQAPMRLVMRSGLIERICPHRHVHPDPDSLRWLGRPHAHRCDGCCVAAVAVTGRVRST